MHWLCWSCWYTDAADALMQLNQDQDLLAEIFIAICSSFRPASLVFVAKVLFKRPELALQSCGDNGTHSISHPSILSILQFALSCHYDNNVWGAREPASQQSSNRHHWRYLDWNKGGGGAKPFLKFQHPFQNPVSGPGWGCKNHHPVRGHPEAPVTGGFEKRARQECKLCGTCHEQSKSSQSAN